jgi:NADH-quinone oxidoreductase subunit L
MNHEAWLYLGIALSPLCGALVSGLLGWKIGRQASHTVAILGVLLAFLGSLKVLWSVIHGQAIYDAPVYTWLTVGQVNISVGFLIDSLSAMMMVVVTSVSLMVHIYTIGYMAEDPGYQRFFSYISLFTFAMLMLVMSNNFIQLFFGWEAVGLVSYLLIGFWFKKSTATYANLKAFLVNRVGDFGFILGIGMVLVYFGGSLNYKDVFAYLNQVTEHPTLSIFPQMPWSVVTITCLLLFVGAMGKSAQFPLHVWLPDSMEGPTPISALIHAATMVTAGIFMVARMSPLFELSEVALSVIMIIGAITALFMGFLGIVQNDIKRVVAYSTLSQLGYMTVALGASAYSVAVFHLMTHAFFKALLFLAAGSVIVGMHHQQDMRHMGGLRRYMPITWFTSLLGSLALIGTPFFSGFYSKDLIIEAVKNSSLFGSGFAYFSVLLGVFVTAFYSFRMYFMVFHGKLRDDHHQPHESPWVITLPLCLLAIPSVFIGFFAVKPMLFETFFNQVIYSNTLIHPAMAILKEEFHGAWAMGMHAFSTAPFWLALSGVGLAWLFYGRDSSSWPEKLRKLFSPIYTLFERKYYLDELYFNVFAKGSRKLGGLFWKLGDQALIDGTIVNGSARVVDLFSRSIRFIQTGLIPHYAIGMVIGLVVLGALALFPY